MLRIKIKPYSYRTESFLSFKDDQTIEKRPELEKRPFTDLASQQNHRDNHMACSKVKKLNSKKNDFSRLKQTETQQILVKKFTRESIVAVSKLDTKYAVMLIYASYCLSAVEANDNNQTDPNSQSDSKDSEDKSIENVGAIVGIVVGILGLIIAALTFYCQQIKTKEPKFNMEELETMKKLLMDKDTEDIKKQIAIQKRIEL